MTRFSALDAKNRFGEVLTAAQRAPVTIERHGKAVAVVVSQADFETLQAAKLELLRAEITKGVSDYEAGRLVDGRELLTRAKAKLAKQ